MVRIVSARNGLEPDSAESHAPHGRILYEKNRYEEAIPHFAEAWSRDRDNAWYPFMIAKCARLARRYDDSRTHIVQALAMDSGKAHYHWERGRLEFDLGRFDQAVPHYRSAVEIDPADKHAWHDLAVSLRRVDRLEEAAEASRRAIALDRGFPAAWWALLTTLHYLGDRSGVQDTAVAASALVDDMASSTQVARHLYHAGATDEARAMLERIVARRTNDAAALLLLGQLYQARGRSADARAMADRVLASQASATERALARELSGDRTGCLEDLARALEAGEHRYGIAAGYARIGEVERALDMLERAIRDDRIEALWARRDPDLTALRSDPRFGVLTALP
jgi:tetratricopeptide (TPR) repeat protein